jgi:hypothetical protein
MTKFDYSNIDYFNQATIDTIRVKQNGLVNLTQAYVQWKHRFNAKLTLNVGVHGQYFDINEKTAIEPRLGVRYALNEKSSINFGYGIHHCQFTMYF